MNNKNNLEKINKELERYKAKDEGLTKVIDLYKGIFEVQESARGDLEPTLPISNKEALDKLKEGHFIIEGLNISINASVFKKAARELAKVFKETSGEKIPVEELLALPQLQDDNLNEFAKDILSNNINYLKDFALKSSFNEQTIFFFLHQLLVPFFQTEAEKYHSSIEESGWKKGGCPFCGSAARYIRLHKDDGRRMLYCPLCRTEWRFMRMACPFCYNTDPKTLRHFYIGKDKNHRVDICDKCKRYIKTTNERNSGMPTYAMVEDVVTIPYDFVAEREGFKREA